MAQKNFLREFLDRLIQMIDSFLGNDKSEIPARPPKNTFSVKGKAASVADNEILFKEFRRKAENFHYLLDATSFFCNKKERIYTRETAETLSEKWEYMLDAKDCKKLLEKFDEIKKTEVACEKTIRAWLKFLENFGLKRFSAEEGKTVLSAENRGDFENGRLFDDGEIFSIKTYPWYLNGEIIIRGEFYSKTRREGSEVVCGRENE